MTRVLRENNYICETVHFNLSAATAKRFILYSYTAQLSINTLEIVVSLNANISIANMKVCII